MCARWVTESVVFERRLRVRCYVRRKEFHDQQIMPMLFAGLPVCIKSPVHFSLFFHHAFLLGQLPLVEEAAALCFGFRALGQRNHCTLFLYLQNKTFRG